MSSVEVILTDAEIRDNFLRVMHDWSIHPVRAWELAGQLHGGKRSLADRVDCEIMRSGCPVIVVRE